MISKLAEDEATERSSQPSVTDGKKICSLRSESLRALQSPRKPVEDNRLALCTGGAGTQNVTGFVSTKAFHFLH